MTLVGFSRQSAQQKPFENELFIRFCSLSHWFGGRTRARTWDPLIKESFRNT
jgi:hypothetical protein